MDQGKILAVLQLQVATGLISDQFTAVHGGYFQKTITFSKDLFNLILKFNMG